MKKSKVIISLLIALAVIFSFCITACAQAETCEHPNLVCAECGKELVQCDQKFVDCEKYYCPADETCPDLRSHMQEYIIFGIVAILLSLLATLLVIPYLIIEIVNKSFGFHTFLLFASDACLICFCFKKAVPCFIEGIKYFT